SATHSDSLLTTHFVQNGNDTKNTTSHAHDDFSSTTSETNAQTGSYDGSQTPPVGVSGVLAGDAQWSLTATSHTLTTDSVHTHHEDGATSETAPTEQQAGSYTDDRTSTGHADLYEHGSYLGGTWSLDSYAYTEADVGAQTFHGQAV